MGATFLKKIFHKNFDVDEGHFEGKYKTNTVASNSISKSLENLGNFFTSIPGVSFVCTYIGKNNSF